MIAPAIVSKTGEQLPAIRATEEAEVTDVDERREV